MNCLNDVVGRTKTFLRQQMRRAQGTIDEEAVDRALSLALSLADLCGEQTRSRKMFQRLALRLLSGPPEIMAPACPDYSHEGGLYTFQGIGDDVSLLAQKQIEFLKQVSRLIPDAGITIAFADHEADDELLRLKFGLSRNKFISLVDSSRRRTEDLVAPLKWRVAFMTTLIPELVSEEEAAADWINGNPGFKSRICTEAIQRGEMYFRIQPGMSTEEKLRRTVCTAAQYIALGRFAARRGYVICNHTTVNLAWYLQTEVALIHNPVSIY